MHSVKLIVNEILIVLVVLMKNSVNIKKSLFVHYLDLCMYIFLDNIFFYCFLTLKEYLEYFVIL